MVDERAVVLSGCDGSVVAVHRSGEHSFSKVARDAVLLVAGMGVAGDAHHGARVQHRSRIRVDPDQPNLRQVHLLHGELFDELRSAGFHVSPGDLGENVTTRGVDLLDLPVGTTLRLGSDALVALTGLRNPCKQIDRHQPGLLTAVLARGESGDLIRKAGVMAVVVQSGEVRPSDVIRVSLPPRPHRPLDLV